MPNILFLQAAAEALPSALQGIAAEIHVNFPWGSLLRGVATGDALILSNLRRICASRAQLKVTIGLDLERDRSEMQRLGVPQISIDYVNSVLAARYKDAGFEILKTERLASLDWPELKTSWARRIKGNPGRSYIRILAQATENAK